MSIRAYRPDSLNPGHCNLDIPHRGIEMTMETGVISLKSTDADGDVSEIPQRIDRSRRL